MDAERKTLQEWADIDGLIIYDPDGFDRTDPEVMTRKRTREEYMQGVYRCSVMGKPVDCKSAEKDSGGQCLGYAPTGDDEPIETCKQCSICTCHGME